MVEEPSEGSSSPGIIGTEEEKYPLSNYPIIPRDEFELGEQLGAGSFGSVYRGRWKTEGREITVALKKVFMLEKEADILSKIRHRNIIQFYGVSQTNPDFFIITEFAEGGSLYDYVHSVEEKEITFSQIIDWAHQIASGVAYLHYEAPETIIHRDLKSKNIVLSRDLICKLCDFGTSKNLTHSWTAPSWGGTAAWMSPEIINQKEGITTATDVWSYGVVLWEMIAREVPYKGLTEFRIYSMIAQQGVTLVIPETCPEALSRLMNNCWQVNPKDRVDMKQIIVALECMRLSKQISRECIYFLQRKHEWKQEIEQQLKHLEAEKVDYAKKLEDLTRREQALRKREDTQRGNNATILTATEDGDVASWDEERVCHWMRLRAVPLALEGEVLDHLIALVLQHNINGNRLLDITLKDLECLGIYSLGIRHNLFREIRNLRKENHRTKNFPSLQVSQQLGQKKKSARLSQPILLPLIIHVTMYTRQSGLDNIPRFRYKILVDTDWEESCMSTDIPIDLHSSHDLVKNVCITVLSNGKNVDLEPIRCDSYPFAVKEWIDSPRGGGTVEVVCAISYTDRVVRPRNTCLRSKVFDFSRPQTLENKQIEVLVRPYPSSPGSRSRRESTGSCDRQTFKNQPSVDSGVGSSSVLQGVWRSRVSSANLMPPPDLSDDSAALVTSPTLVGKSPLWSNIAAGILNSATTPTATSTLTNSPSGSSLRTSTNGPSGEKRTPVRWTTGGVRHIDNAMGMRKLSGTANRGRRRPMPIIVPRRKFSSNFPRETHSANIGVTQAPIYNRVALSGDVPLNDTSESNFAAGPIRLDLEDSPGSASTEKLDVEISGESKGDSAGKSRRRRRHRPHKKTLNSDVHESPSEDSLNNSFSNCNINPLVLVVDRNVGEA